MNAIRIQIVPLATKYEVERFRLGLADERLAIATWRDRGDVVVGVRLDKRQFCGTAELSGEEILAIVDLCARFATDVRRSVDYYADADDRCRDIVYFSAQRQPYWLAGLSLEVWMR